MSPLFANSRTMGGSHHVCCGGTNQKAPRQQDFPVKIPAQKKNTRSSGELERAYLGDTGLNFLHHHCTNKGRL